MTLRLLRPDWPAPGNVQALCTTRTGGHSRGPWCSMNLGMNSGDDVRTVHRNRETLAHNLSAQPQWLEQVHGTQVIAHPGLVSQSLEGDALVTQAAGQVCAVLTADCLPVFFCNRLGTSVAVAHAGWRGLAGGILEATVRAMDETPGEVIAWLGPAIGPSAYEVGEDVKKAFADVPPDCFTRHGPNWLFDLYHAARHKLTRFGVNRIHGGDFCTFSEQEKFFSYRRDRVTGRMASLIWLEKGE